MASTHPTHSSPEEAKRLRKQLGKILKDMRTDEGLTQRQLADSIGFVYYTMVSQIEGGHARIPPEKVKVYAQALRVPVKDFAMLTLKHYDPITYSLIK